jgi:hypothetical protein
MTAPGLTDPSGRCFVSYRRSRLGEISQIIAALHDHGVPTWQDLADLEEAPLEPALRATLDDVTTASGILWITPDVSASPIITGVEIPALITRAERGDRFYLVPVAAGGLDYTGAAVAALTRTSLADFGGWNLARVDHNPITEADAAYVARRVLARRVAAVHSVRPADASFVIDVYTRGPAVLRPDAALTMDLTHRFDGRQAHADAWETYILPAVETVIDEAARHAAGRLLQLRGNPGIPAAVALGSTLLAPRALDAVWMQHTPGRPLTPYSIAAPRRSSGFRIVPGSQRPNAVDIAVLVNVSDDTTPAFRATGGLPEFRGYVRADPPDGYPHMFPGAGEALDLAHKIIGEIRTARRQYGRLGDLHLFMAGPAGLAFLLGQLLNTVGTVRTYEHVSDDGIGHYEPAVVLRPAD